MYKTILKLMVDKIVASQFEACTSVKDEHVSWILKPPIVLLSLNGPYD